MQGYVQKHPCMIINIHVGCLYPIRRHVDGIEILDEHILHQQGSFLKVRMWLRGRHPNLGTIIFGLTGVETVVERDIIRPMGTFLVTQDADQTILRRTDNQCSESIGTQEEFDHFRVDGNAIQYNQGCITAVVSAG